MGGKTAKVVVCGMKGVGKTAILEQVIYRNISSDSEIHPTIEDIYVANIETDKGTREQVRFYDTAGIGNSQTATAHGTTSQQLLRHYLVLADGYLLVYDTSKTNSLDVLMSLKKDIDKNKDKKEVTIIVLGNQSTRNDEQNARQLNVNRAIDWCSREKIRHFTVSAMDRTTLYEPFMYIASKLNPPPSKTSFTPLSMGRKVLKESS